MNIEGSIKVLQQLRGRDCTTYEQQCIDMAEAAPVELVNYQGDGPRSKNVEREIKYWRN